MRGRLTNISVIVTTITAISACTSNHIESNDKKWVSLYNGKNLAGWIAKFKGQPLGENHLDTFKVENGLLTVSYDNWLADNADQFGHLFTEQSYSNYRIRVEYRFVGEQLSDDPKLKWAYRNNGVMLHTQPPATMGIDQAFPISGESQLLGGNGFDDRPTGNFCSPSTNIVKNGNLITAHCVKSHSSTFHGDQWVWFEAEVHANGKIKHYVNDELVFEYDELQIDPTDPLGAKWLALGNPLKLTKGHIALQAETHPTQFRTIEIQSLD